jgi:hypothetical protein
LKVRSRFNSEMLMFYRASVSFQRPMSSRGLHRFASLWANSATTARCVDFITTVTFLTCGLCVNSTLPYEHLSCVSSQGYNVKIFRVLPYYVCVLRSMRGSGT